MNRAILCGLVLLLASFVNDAHSTVTVSATCTGADPEPCICVHSLAGEPEAKKTPDTQKNVNNNSEIWQMGVDICKNVSLTVASIKEFVTANLSETQANPLGFYANVFKDGKVEAFAFSKLYIHKLAAPGLDFQVTLKFGKLQVEGASSKAVHFVFLIKTGEENKTNPILLKPSSSNSELHVKMNSLGDFRVHGTNFGFHKGCGRDMYYVSNIAKTMSAEKIDALKSLITTTPPAGTIAVNVTDTFPVRFDCEIERKESKAPQSSLAYPILGGLILVTTII